eukprot:13525493-Ditylum_brightwellii.AAC.1
MDAAREVHQKTSMCCSLSPRTTVGCIKIMVKTYRIVVEFQGCPILKGHWIYLSKGALLQKIINIQGCDAGMEISSVVLGSTCQERATGCYNGNQQH